jgi:hypothetical protein
MGDAEGYGAFGAGEFEGGGGGEGVGYAGCGAEGKVENDAECFCVVSGHFILDVERSGAYLARRLNSKIDAFPEL